jgi:RNA polymerase sigma-70 factor (ECF subfamily)
MEDLLQKIALGDPDAFHLLYRQYSSTVQATARLYLKDPALIKDIIQTVFMKLWEKRQQLPAIGEFENYLFILVRNTVLDQLRKEARDVKMRLEIVRSEPVYRNEEPAILSKEYQALLHAAIARLPPQQQQVYRMAREEELSHEMIAARMNLSKLTVKKHMELALRSIREFFRQHFSSTILGLCICRIIYYICR